MSTSFCAQVQHCWYPTSAPGWYQCRAVVDTRMVKQGHGEVMRLVTCGAVAHCPGCLGYCISKYPVVRCQMHVSLDLSQLPLIVHRDRSSSAFPAPSGEQQTLW